MAAWMWVNTWQHGLLCTHAMPRWLHSLCTCSKSCIRSTCTLVRYIVDTIQARLSLLTQRGPAARQQVQRLVEPHDCRRQLPALVHQHAQLVTHGGVVRTRVVRLPYDSRNPDGGGAATHTGSLSRVWWGEWYRSSTGMPVVDRWLIYFGCPGRRHAAWNAQAVRAAC